LTPTLAGSGEKTELGVVSRADVEVTQADWAPLVEVVHPAGKAGVVTPQFSVAMKVKGWTTAVPLVLRTP
jgi:hypothetical protein